MYKNINTKKIMKIKFRFSLICAIVVLLGGIYACITGVLINSIASIIIGAVLAIVAIASFFEIKRNKAIAYENDVSSRVSNSFFGDWLFKPCNCVAFFIKNANKFNILIYNLQKACGLFICGYEKACGVLM